MRRYFACILAILLSSSPAMAALVRGTPATLDQDAITSPWTFTLTTTAGQNVLILLCASSSTTDVFASATVTFDSVAMVKVMTNFNSGEASNVGVWELANPNIGSSLTVSITPSASQDGGCIAVPYSGGNTSDPTSGEVWEANDGVEATNQDVTCASGNEVLSAISITNIGKSPVLNGGQTDLFSGDDGSSHYLFSAEPGSGTNNVGVTWTGSTGSGHIALCVNAGAAATVLKRRAVVVE